MNRLSCHRSSSTSVLKSLPLLLGVLTILIVSGLVAPSAQASVFQTSARWTPNSKGYVVIQVCVIEGSDTTEKGDGAQAGLIHDTNPSLAAVLQRVKVALINSWEKYSSVRFVGWKMCNDLTTAERAQTVGLFIHPDAENRSFIGTDGRGKTTPDNRGIQFKPWGNSFNRCIDYNWRTTHVEYSYDCVEQYAIHEFGHALGFLHEWTHPLTSSACRAVQTEHQVSAGEYSATYPTDKSYFIVNPNDYDSNSIMTYDDKCADVTGVRFGSENLSPYDIAGVKAVYPPATRGQFDVGVFRGIGVCSDTEPITIYMDDEDGSNGSGSSGWIGASHVDRNTTLEFCREDGTRFGKLAASSANARSADYAVLKLGDSCPAGSVEITRYLDNEDQNNENFIVGDAFPNRQNFDETSLPGFVGSIAFVKSAFSETELHMCLFRPENPGGVTLDSLPTLSYAYGVAAASDFVGAVSTGVIQTDDEDVYNKDRLDAPDEATLTAAERIIGGERDTTINIARVSNVSVSAARGLNSWYTSAVVASLDGEGPVIRFVLDGGADQIYSQPLTITDNGIHTLTVYSTDTQGNRIGKTQTLTILIDTTGPVISAVATPSATAYGWNNTDVVAHFTATDNISGVARISSDITLINEGAGQSATATAFDKAGNRSDFTLNGINIDKTLPVVTYSGNAGSYLVDATLKITCSSSDSLSGVASDTCKPITGPAYLFPLGINTFSANATDKAGNVGTASTSFVLRVTFNSLKNVVSVVCNNPGVAQSLNSKLVAAEASAMRANQKAKEQQLGAFINEVNAQTSKSITPEMAVILIRLSKAL